MKESELIKIIAEQLEFDEAIITKDANVHSLIMIYLYLSDNDDHPDRLKLRIDALSNEVAYDGLTVDLSAFFDSSDANPILYKEQVGRDGFTDSTIVRLNLFLTIEHAYDFNISDEFYIAFEENYLKTSIRDFFDFYMKHSTQGKVSS